MADEKEAEKKEIKWSMKWLIETLKFFSNKTKDGISHIRKNGRGLEYGRRRHEKLKPYSEKWLTKIRKINDQWINDLKEVEQHWANIDYLMGYSHKPAEAWGKKNDGSISHLYSKIGPWKETIPTVFEMAFFKWGTRFSTSTVQDNFSSEPNHQAINPDGGPIEYEIIDVPPRKTLIHADGMKEELMPIGFMNFDEGITGRVEGAVNSCEILDLSNVGFEESDIKIIDKIAGRVIDLIKTVKKHEKDQHDHLKEVFNILTNINSTWSSLDDYRPRKGMILERTYLQIARWIYKTRRNGAVKYYWDPQQSPIDDSICGDEEARSNLEVVYFKDTVTNDGRGVAPFQHSFVKYDWEVEAGLDHNGMPLEVEQDGTVLTDKWWIEILRNPWQKKVILSKIAPNNPPTNQGPEKDFYDAKPFKGGYAKVIRQIVDHFSQPGVRARKVDKKFTKLMDIGETGMRISCEWDSYRDDHRDARFHKYSMTTYDYTTAMWSYDYKTFINKPEHWGILPANPVTKSFDPLTSWSTATPMNFEELDPDKYIERTYKGLWSWDFNRNDGLDFEKYPIKENDDNTNPENGWYLNTKTGTINSDNSESRYSNPDPDHQHPGMLLARKPTHLNPAFDRRALNANFNHWGRMYYYEWPGDVGKYSENPFPAISDRGIVNYLVDVLMKRELKIKDQRAFLKKSAQGYDWGIRQQGVRTFKKNILDPDGAINYGHKPGDAELIQPNC